MSAPLSPHAELRRQCLQWAFQTREFTDKPHTDVLDVAKGYYAFVMGQTVTLDDREAREKLRALVEGRAFNLL
ncbi:hypothetical protein NHN26_16740 [Rhodovulum tesquicola]|uniref:hypothetical protein n=1 Tax=Rhodovulum tesquicola TaxID=540254 RepID=UPI0020975237|nr:hypothetical protein [Rhodovulum tesquicola]MCO8146853.1 hypothetical protein [Rhodovulum tesquicola]